MIFLSYGGGVQSSVMLKLALAGEIDRPDHVLFSDPGWESRTTYENVARFRGECERAGIGFHIVSGGNIRDDMTNARTAGSGKYNGRWASMPLYVLNKNGIQGKLRRQCTAEYKLEPIRRKQRELLGYAPRQRIPPGSAATMIGISTDEARRAAPARERWVDNLYPLIDPLKMSRADCQAWWEERFGHVALTKSACLGCPYTSDKAWRDMKANRPDEWLDVCEFDETIRKANGMIGDSFVHRSNMPLREAPIGDDQLSLGLDDELYCAGGCGL